MPVNILLRNIRGAWYIASVRLEPDGSYVTGGLLYCPEDIGSVGLENPIICAKFRFATKEDAIRKCKDLAKMKEKRAKFIRWDFSDVPREIQRYMAPELDTQLSPADAIAMLHRAKHQYCIFFKDVLGISEWFDAEVEYLAEENPEDAEMMFVWDKYGDRRECSKARMSVINPTEEALLLAKTSR